MEGITQNIKVSASAGPIDGLQSAGRSLVVVVGFITAALGLLKVHDIAGIINLIETNGGQVLSAVSGLIAFGTMAYGVFKSYKRGTQIATVAGSADVPSEVAQLK